MLMRNMVVHRVQRVVHRVALHARKHVPYPGRLLRLTVVEPALGLGLGLSLGLPLGLGLQGPWDVWVVQLVQLFERLFGLSSSFLRDFFGLSFGEWGESAEFF